MASPSPQADLDPEWAAQSNLLRFLVLTGIFNILALISVVLRLYARIGILRTPGRDDFVIVLAAVSAYALLSTVFNYTYEHSSERSRVGSALSSKVLMASADIL
jgi:hypothetical protein